MKNRNIGFGIFLLTVGIVWALVNTGVIEWSVFNSITVLWPLILVVMGINIVFKDNPIVKTVTWLLFLAVVIAFGYFNEAGRSPGLNYGNEIKSERVFIEKSAETKSGELKLALGGTNIRLDAGTQGLLEAEISDPDVKYYEEFKNNRESVSISFKKQSYRFIAGRNTGASHSNFHLDRNIVWDFDFKIGAVNGTLDMSELKVRDMDIDIGAGNLKLTCGSGYESSRINIDAGASKISLEVPEKAGVRIKVNGIFSRQNLERLGWEERSGYYFSPNYESAVEKIDIDIDMGAGALDVEVI